MGQIFTLDHLKFEIGELVTTNIMGEYGIIVGFGRHIKYTPSQITAIIIMY
jgi:hypothetical protein